MIYMYYEHVRLVFKVHWKVFFTLLHLQPLLPLTVAMQLQVKAAFLFQICSFRWVKCYHASNFSRIHTHTKDRSNTSELFRAFIYI